MKLTPLDIKKQEFKKVMRGYDPVEVDTFMDMMANEFEDVLKQQKETRDRSIELDTQLKDYRADREDPPADAAPGAGGHGTDLRVGTERSGDHRQGRGKQGREDR